MGGAPLRPDVDHAVGPGIRAGMCPPRYRICALRDAAPFAGGLFRQELNAHAPGCGTFRRRPVSARIKCAPPRDAAPFAGGLFRQELRQNPQFARLGLGNGCPSAAAGALPRRGSNRRPASPKGGAPPAKARGPGLPAGPLEAITRLGTKGWAKPEGTHGSSSRKGRAHAALPIGSYRN
jgi:hypothetical protein